MVEAGTGLAFGLVAAWVSARAGTPSWPLLGHGLFHPAAVAALVAFLYLAAVSIALALIDIDVKRLPFWIVTPSWFVGAATLGGAALLAGNRGAVIRMVIGGVGLWALYRLLHAVYPRGMAYGDVRLAGLIGGYLAWIGCVAIMATVSGSNLAVSLVGVELGLMALGLTAMAMAVRWVRADRLGA